MSPGLHLFEGFGIELEYMIVDRQTLDVLAVTDEVLEAIAGAYEAEVEVGDLCWSNELALHVIELKTGGPVSSLDGLAERFQHDVQRINGMLAERNGMLMPTAMHPWMDPHTETKLWPYEYSPVYEAFDRIFGCQGHGWSNLQSTHINLPFSGDEEFGRLHAAIRLLLPILPALAASSPVADGRMSGSCDTRLVHYRHNARAIPSVTGRVIPENAFTRQDYETSILQRLYQDIAPHDATGVLQHEWLNARGAIARFDRGAIEIRLLDIQECPRADLAIARLIAATLAALVGERWTSYEQQRLWSIEPLEQVFLEAVRDGDQARITRPEYAAALGMSGSGAVTAAALWRHIFETVFTPAQRESTELEPLRVVLREGCLARRMVDALGAAPDRRRIADVFRALCECLAQGTLFHAAR